MSDDLLLFLISTKFHVAIIGKHDEHFYFSVAYSTRSGDLWRRGGSFLSWIGGRCVCNGDGTVAEHGWETRF